MLTDLRISVTTSMNSRPPKNKNQYLSYTNIFYFSHFLNKKNKIIYFSCLLRNLFFFKCKKKYRNQKMKNQDIDLIDAKYEPLLFKQLDLPELDHKQQNKNSTLSRKKAVTEYQTRISSSQYTAPQQTESYLYTHNSYLFKEKKTQEGITTPSSSSKKKKKRSRLFFWYFFCFKLQLRKKNSKVFLGFVIKNHSFAAFLHFTLFVSAYTLFIQKKEANDQGFESFLLVPSLINFLILLFLVRCKSNLNKLRSTRYFSQVKNGVLVCFTLNAFNIFFLIFLGFIYALFYRDRGKSRGLEVAEDVGFLILPFFFILINFTYFGLCCCVFKAVNDIGRKLEKRMERGN